MDTPHDAPSPSEIASLSTLLTSLPPPPTPPPAPSTPPPPSRLREAFDALRAAAEALAPRPPSPPAPAATEGEENGGGVTLQAGWEEKKAAIEALVGESSGLLVLCELLRHIDGVGLNRAVVVAVKSVLASESAELALIKRLVKEEVYTCPSRHLLFCRYKPVSMLIEAFVEEKCSDLLGAALAPIVDEILASTPPPPPPHAATASPASPGSSAAAAAVRIDDSADSLLDASVLSWSLRILDALMLSAHLVPAAVVGLFANLRAAMVRQFADQPSLQIAPVVVFLLLRYVVLATADPFGYNLTPAPPPPAHARVFRATARRLRTLVTWYLWRSAPAVGAVLEPSLAAIDAFVDTISTPTPDSKATVVPFDGAATVAALLDDLADNRAPPCSRPPHTYLALDTHLSLAHARICLPSALATLADIVTRSWPLIATGLELHLPDATAVHAALAAMATAHWAPPCSPDHVCDSAPSSSSVLPPPNPLVALVARARGLGTRSGAASGGVPRDAESRFTGAALVAWLLAHTDAESHYAAARTAQQLVDARLVYNAERATDGGFVDDDSLFRFQEDEPARVLNRSILHTAPARPPAALSLALVSAALVLFDMFGNMRGDVLARHLKHIRTSSAFRVFTALTAELQTVALDDLPPQHRLAFFANIYNAGYMHAAVVSPPPSAAAARAAWEKRARYQLGPLGVLSLFDIEHAVVRAAAPAHPRIPKYRGVFPAYDAFSPLAPFVCTSFDPRTAFILSHGTLTAPLVTTLTPHTTATHLHDAACAYVRENAVVDVRKQTVTLPEYVRVYAGDLGSSHKEILYFVLAHASPATRSSLESMIHGGLTLHILFDAGACHTFFSVSVANSVLRARPDVPPLDLGAPFSPEHLAPPSPSASDEPQQPRVPRPSFALPQLAGTSAVLTDAMVGSLWGWIPERYMGDELVLGFQAGRDGYNLDTLMGQAGGLGPAVVVMQTAKGNVIGAYLSHGLEPSASFAGSGETFIFTLHPEMRAFRWRRGRPPHFVRATDAQLAIGGGGGGGFGLWIDAELLHGGSARCHTFANDPLVDPDTSFQCTALEAWLFSSELSPSTRAALLDIGA